VGVGQVELDVAEAAATTVVVLNPGWGDEIQAAKAGLMEVADIFVLNKCDRPGAEESQRDLEHLLGQPKPGQWRPPVVCTRAHEGHGVPEVWAAIRAHRAHLTANGGLAAWRTRFLGMALKALLLRALEERVGKLARGQAFAAALAAVAAGEQGLHAARDELLAGLQP